MTKLTKNFSLEEFTHSQTAARKGIANEPPPRARQNLYRLTEVLEKVRNILNNHLIIISSGYRGPELNAAVGGSKSSAHMQGLAADFICPDFDVPLAICLELEPHMVELQIDQLIHEFNQWCHLGLTIGEPRHQCLTIDKNGTRIGFS